MLFCFRVNDGIKDGEHLKILFNGWKSALKKVVDKCSRSGESGPPPTTPEEEALYTLLNRNTSLVAEWKVNVTNF